ncbi:MAG: two pore domain potassium channel family protein, partial [Deltaproteobacteria bacterium]|nr:two pore domain potassium channel family protein [Deltaproteobacteria bacterium]
VSFTTLGYGDYHPSGWSRVVGASEGFIGAFFMAMFVLTVGRKMNR